MASGKFLLYIIVCFVKLKNKMGAITILVEIIICYSKFAHNNSQSKQLTKTN
jgi:hypothetical protein